MTARRNLPAVTAALLTGLFAVGALGGLLQAAPLGADRAGTGGIFQQATPAPVAPSAGPCRVVAGPFALDAEADPPTFWSRVQNVGSSPTTLQTLQVGWDGSASLTAVLLRRAGGGLQTVYTGTATSPALLGLASADEDGLTLRPGEEAWLGLRQEDGQASPPTAAVLFLREGCRLALGPAVAPCPLEAGALQPRAGSDDHVVLELRNSADTPAPLAAVEVSWPIEKNGPLVALWVDGVLAVDLGKGLANSPAAIDLARVAEGVIEVPAKGALSLALVFAGPAADGPYVVSAWSHDGCGASATTWLAEPECAIGLGGFETRANTARLRLVNEQPITRTLTSVAVFWPTEANGPLVGVTANGRPVWTDNIAQAPAVIGLEDGVLIGPRATLDVRLAFSPTLATGRPDSGIAGGDYTIIAGFRSGCRLVFSTIGGQPVGCSLSSGEIDLDGTSTEAKVSLTNAGAEATLRTLALTWPARNGPLTGIWLGDLPLYTGEYPPGPEPFVIQRAADNPAIVPRNASRALRLRFRDRASRSGYGLSLAFDDVAGEPCANLVINSRAVEPDCRLSLGTIELRQFDAEIALANDGDDEVEIRSVDVEWPNPGRENELREVALVGAGPPVVVWSGFVFQSPAHLFANGPVVPIVDAHSRVTLRLTFTRLFTDPDDDRKIKVTVSAVEGCQASYAPDGGQVRPEREKFSGLIRDLPRGGNLFEGGWTIDTSTGQRIVTVSRSTRLDPSTVTPRIGDIVDVLAIKDGNELLAEEIKFVKSPPPASVLGQITRIDPDHSPPRWIVIESTAVTILETTIVEGDLVPDAQAYATGVSSPTGGGILASRIKVQSPPVGERVAVTGVIQAAEPGQPAGEPQVWTVDHYRVLVKTSNVEPFGGLPPFGRRVRIEGRLVADDTITDADAYVYAPIVTREVEGRIALLPAGGLLGAWTLETADGPETFTVDSLAIVDTRSAPARVGLRAFATIQVDGAQVIALRVRTDWPE